MSGDVSKKAFSMPVDLTFDELDLVKQAAAITGWSPIQFLRLAAIRASKETLGWAEISRASMEDVGILDAMSREYWRRARRNRLPNRSLIAFLKRQYVRIKNIQNETD